MYKYLIGGLVVLAIPLSSCGTMDSTASKDAVYEKFPVTVKGYKGDKKYLEKALITYNNYEESRETGEFWAHLFQEIEQWEKLKLKENEKKVLDAIKILFDSIDDIEIFNKKAIYLYMREITGLNTKQIVSNLNRIRKRYRTFKGEWEKGNI